MSAYQPKTGAKCGCRRGVQRDNCPHCEGTGMMIDFKAIRACGGEDMNIQPKIDGLSLLTTLTTNGRNADMLVNKTFPSGVYSISDIINGVLVTRQYVGYTKREAIAEFKREMKGRE